MRTAAAAMMLVLGGGLTGCSLNKFAVNKLGDALANPGTTYAADDDPELIAGAVPFSLKLIESLLETSPRHEGLLLAAASGFAQYSYAFVQQEADLIEEKDFARATELRARAKRLHLRARDYGLRGLDVRHAGFSVNLRRDTRAAVTVATAKDVPLLYWTAAAWGASISLSKDTPDLVADQPIVEALIDRAAALDESWNAGAIHAFLITYEMARNGAPGEPAERARRHLDRAVELSKGQAAAPYVSWAEAVSLPKNDRAGFEAALTKALAVDANARPEWRLENTIMQRRAKWLMSRVEDLFLGSP